ncbi:MAG: putative nucleotidyltransferase [Woeseiaceae bacterium]|jgi:predicted nucleotidyltransferase
MTRESLDISGKLDDASIDVIEAIAHEAEKHSIPFIIVGAAARDMFMQHFYGVAIHRATDDVDIAVDVSDWTEYQSLTASLVSRGFETTNQTQRLRADNQMVVDIVPFESIADTNGNIQWPPDQDIEMNVLGFQEALHNPVELMIRKTPKLVVPVISVPGFLLLKLIAWGDRTKDLRPKDALDIKFILQKYASIDPAVDSVWTQPELIALYEGDTECVAAQILGRLVNNLANAESIKVMEVTFSAKLLETFCTEMSPRGASDFDENYKLMEAFIEVFNST